MATGAYERAARGIIRGMALPANGQSTSGNGNATGPVVDGSTPLPGIIQTFPVGVRILPNHMGDQSLVNTKVQEADLGPFVDGRETTTGGSGCTGLIECARQLAEWMRVGGIPECIAPFATGIGEGQYASTKKGTTPWNNLGAGLRAARGNYAAMGLGFRAPVLLAADTEGNAFESRATAVARINEQCADWVALASSVDGLTIPRFVVKDQSSGWANQGVPPSLNQAVLGVLDAMTPNPINGGIGVMGPRYPCSHGDALHRDEAGAKRWGALMARTIYRLLSGQDARPLYPTVCRWQGGYATVKLEFPMARGGLRYSPIVSDPGNAGIATHNDEGTMPGVASYAIAETNNFYWGHSAVTTGANRRLSIAMQPGAGIWPNFPRSTLCDNDVDAFGASLPNHACHWMGLITA